MAERNMSQSELYLCARLLRSLAHRVRGDLSVITNDLAYIATVVDPSHVERARNRCGRISEGLGHIGALSEADEKVVVPSTIVLRTLGVAEAESAIGESLGCKVSRKLIESLVQVLREVIGEWKVCVHGSAHCSQEGEPLTVELFSLRSAEFAAEYPSFMAYAEAQLGERLIVEAGLIDLIVRDHQWSMAVGCVDHRVVIRARIPLVHT
ncbi:MAG: hypothetical protein ACK5GN_14760 [Pseudomonadota bacterium]|jgi:hypothetical protein